MRTPDCPNGASSGCSPSERASCSPGRSTPLAAALAGSTVRRVALDVDPVIFPKQIIKRQAAVPIQICAKLSDVSSGERMIHTDTSRGARPDSHRSLGACMSGHKAAVVEQALNLSILPMSRSLHHEGFAVGGKAQRLECILGITGFGHATDTDPRGAEWSFKVKRRFPSGKPIGRVHEPPFGLWERQFVQ